jgi:DNA-binding IclR family transcriptional regulator
VLASSNYSQTMARGLALLRVLAAHPQGLSVTELAGELRTHRAGVYRLLAPLAEARIVRRAGDGNYVLGLGLVELASAVQPRLQEAASAELRALAEEVGATTALTVRDGEEAVVVAVVEPRSTNMHVAYRPGLRHPVSIAASGLAILAGNPPRAGERQEVEQARRRGYAVSSGELLPGATGVAAPVVVGDAAEASVSAVWAGERDAAAPGALVVATAARIARALA